MKHVKQTNFGRWAAFMLIIGFLLFLVGYCYYLVFGGSCGHPVDAISIPGCMLLFPLVGILTSLPLFFAAKFIAPGYKRQSAITVVVFNIVLLMMLY